MLNSIHSTSDDLRFPALFRRAATFLPTGIAILSAENVAMTVSSLHCVSFDPPMVSVAMSGIRPKVECSCIWADSKRVCFAKESRAWQKVKACCLTTQLWRCIAR